MPTLKEFSANFNGHALPNELEQVFKFQNKCGDEAFSEGFRLSSNVKDGLYYGWSKHPDFLNKLFPFARANHSGSFYAFWNNSTDGNLSAMPIVLFGDEGGEHIVGEDLLQLLRILTYDSEPMVLRDKVIYYKDEEQYHPSPKLESFKQWIKQAFNIDPTDSPAEIVNLAQTKYQAVFNNWKSKYLQV